MPYTPRLDTTGMPYPWWETGNWYYDNGNGLPNCTCYCYGRAAEIVGHWYTPELPHNDAGGWFNDAVNAGLPTGSVPQLGAIICWYSPSGQWFGHVATVEVINADGSIVVSQSGWPDSYFWTSTLYPGNGYIDGWMQPPNRDYVCQGFIYNTDQPIPPGGPWGPWTLVNYLRKQRKRRGR